MSFLETAISSCLINSYCGFKIKKKIPSKGEKTLLQKISEKHNKKRSN